jgi:hypothetical protein
MPDPAKPPLLELWRRSNALDRVTVGYMLAFAVALVLLGRESPSWVSLFVTHIVLSGVIACVIWFWHDRTVGVAGFIRLLYPVLLYSLFYRELEIADHWIVPGFLDQHVVAFERAIFGVDPNIWIISAQTSWANEIMMLGYFSYYFLIPIVALPLFLRQQIGDLFGLLFGTTVAFVISYIGFVVFPVEGPRYFFADQFPGPLSGWIFVPAVQYVIANGAIHGGCMPSSHVAVALVTLFWARRAIPTLGRVLTPFVFVLIIATAWGRFHYVTDAFVGIIVGVGALALTGFWSRTANERKSEFDVLDSVRANEVHRERA